MLVQANQTVLEFEEREVMCQCFIQLKLMVQQLYMLNLCHKLFIVKLFIILRPLPAFLFFLSPLLILFLFNSFINHSNIIPQYFLVHILNYWLSLITLLQQELGYSPQSYMEYALGLKEWSLYQDNS